MIAIKALRGHDTGKSNSGSPPAMQGAYPEAIIRQIPVLHEQMDFEELQPAAKEKQFFAKSRKKRKADANTSCRQQGGSHNFCI